MKKERRCFVQRCRGEVKIDVCGVLACDEHTQQAWDAVPNMGAGA